MEKGYWYTNTRGQKVHREESPDEECDRAYYEQTIEDAKAAAIRRAEADEWMDPEQRDWESEDASGWN